MASSSSLVYALIIVWIIIVQALLGACNPPVDGTGDNDSNRPSTDPSTGPADIPPPQAVGGSGAIPKRRNNAGPQGFGFQRRPPPSQADRNRRQLRRSGHFEQQIQESQEEILIREEDKKKQEYELLRLQRDQRRREEERKKMFEELERERQEEIRQAELRIRQEAAVRQREQEEEAQRREQEQVEIPEEHQQYGASGGELGVFTRGGEELDPGSEGDNTWDRDLHDQSQHLPQQDPRLNVRLRPGVCLQWPYIPNVPDQGLDHSLHDRRQWNIQPQTQDQRPWNIQEIGERPWNIQERANQPASARTASRRRHNADRWYSERRGWNVQPHSGRPDDNDAVSVRSTSGVQSWQNGPRPWNVQAGAGTDNHSGVVAVHGHDDGLLDENTMWMFVLPLLLTLVVSYICQRQHGHGRHHNGICFHCRDNNITFSVGLFLEFILFCYLMLRYVFLG